MHQNQKLTGFTYFSLGKSGERVKEGKGEKRRLFHTNPSRAQKVVFSEEIGIRENYLIASSDNQPLNLHV